ncbi:creatinine amidohydrolase [Klebsiella michiganensis]|nr:creatinine amidohydrolase [Klebsiella michiganensis]
MKLHHLNEREARRALQKARIALLPLGAVEPHGDHLPLDTDNLLAERFCALLDDQLGECALSLPVVSYSQVWSLRGHAGAIDIGNERLTSLLVSLAENMASYGITTTAVINAHYGNFDAIKAASRQLKEQGITLLGYSWAGMDEEVKKRQTSAVAYPGYMHADEVETSLMLALAPEFVNMTKARPTPARIFRRIFVISRYPGPRSLIMRCWAIRLPPAKRKGARLSSGRWRPRWFPSASI